VFILGPPREGLSRRKRGQGTSPPAPPPRGEEGKLRWGARRLRVEERRNQLEVKPIGIVHNAVAGGRYTGWDEVVSEIRLAPELEEAAEGLEEFSHLIVIFWLDRAHAPDAAKIHPKDQPDLPLVGYLATRSPNRPNPLGLTVVRLLERRGNVLVVQGLDAYDGTPVLDVKPYMPAPDEGIRVPAWVGRLTGQERSGKR